MKIAYVHKSNEIAIVRLPNTNYLNHHPYPEDIYWVIEVSSTTLEDDLNKKKKIYAKAGINEYWVVDLKDTELIVFREPSGNNYKAKMTLNKEIVYSLTFPNIQIEVKKILIE